MNIAKYIYLKVIKELDDIFSIKDGTDVIGTIATIKKNVSVRGSNVWILISAAMLASIGLDVPSQAVIIGAMLISPLMTPILGVGLGFGISDRDLLIKSIKNFSIAVAVSLVASTIYFTLTPLGQPTPELLARTRPTLLDVGVALFGGIAGIVANSRKEKTSVIPGVAIATALMPPLCTAGFGIATGRLEVFLGAFYLFFINAVFISLSTYAVVRYLDFPYYKFIDSRTKKRIQRYIAVFALIVMIPSGMIFYDVVIEAREKRNIQGFVDQYMKNDDFETIRWEIIPSDSTDILKMFLIGDPISSEEENKLFEKMKEEKLDKYRLRLVQMNVPDEEKDKIRREVAGDVTASVLAQVALNKEVQTEKDLAIDSLEAVIEQLRINPGVKELLDREIHITFPEIKSQIFGTISNYNDSTSKFTMVSMLEFEDGIRQKDREKIISRYVEFVKIRLDKDSITVYQKN